MLFFCGFVCTETTAVKNLSFSSDGLKLPLHLSIDICNSFSIHLGGVMKSKMGVTSYCISRSLAFMT